MEANHHHHPPTANVKKGSAAFVFVIVVWYERIQKGEGGGQIMTVSYTELHQPMRFYKNLSCGYGGPSIHVISSQITNIRF